MPWKALLTELGDYRHGIINGMVTNDLIRGRSICLLLYHLSMLTSIIIM